MFKWLQSRVLWGVLLIVAGVMFLIQAIFNIQLGTIFWGLLFILAGIFFFMVYFNDRQNWWAIIPGCTLAGIGISSLLSGLFPSLPDPVSGAFVLGGIGVSFAWVYFNDRRNWWAIIPAGVMLTLVAVTVLGDLVTGTGTAGILFIGMGITFAVLAMVNTPAGPLRWAWIPAGVLFVMGLVFIATAGQFAVYILPAALILGGLVLLVRVVMTR
jgi:uncharacterized membrane protein HdeD (DUF308 family)